MDRYTYKSVIDDKNRELKFNLYDPVVCIKSPFGIINKPHLEVNSVFIVIDVIAYDDKPDEIIYCCSNKHSDLLFKEDEIRKLTKEEKDLALASFIINGFCNAVPKSYTDIQIDRD